MDSPSESAIDVMAYEPPLSLWSLVETYVPSSEREEVKDMLGESLVQQSLELHDEVNMLLDIWRDYRDETDEITKQQTSLPEPPEVRDRLKQEIRFFVESIREKGQQNGRNSNILAKHNAQVLEYVMENKRPGSTCSSRPSTARSSRDGRETPMLSPRSDKNSLSSIVSEEVDSMNDKLNILKFDEVVQNLRDALEKEVQTLLNDITYLQKCLDEEADFRSTSRMEEEPSLSDLKGERSKLEKELMRTISSPDMPDVSSLSLKHKEPVRKSSLTPSPPKKLAKATPALASKSRPTSSNSGPLKASHSISPQMLQAAQAAAGSSNSPSVLDLGPSHVTVRTARLSSGKLVKVGSISASATSGNQDGDKIAPSPPAMKKPCSARPTSANRFRKMVLECREGT